MPPINTKRKGSELRTGRPDTLFTLQLCAAKSSNAFYTVTGKKTRFSSTVERGPIDQIGGCTPAGGSRYSRRLFKGEKSDKNLGKPSLLRWICMNRSWYTLHKGVDSPCCAICADLSRPVEITTYIHLTQSMSMKWREVICTNILTERPSIQGLGS